MAEISEPRASTLADGVEESLLEYIRSSGLTAGDALPKEEELAARMRVSRHIVREGISRLKTLGMVESRRRTAGHRQNAQNRPGKPRVRLQIRHRRHC